MRDEDEKAFRERLQEIGRLIADLDRIPDERVRTAVRELVQRVTELHGAGMEKVLEIVFAQGGAGAKTIEQLAQDRVVGSLMVLHGLHPDSLETRVRRATEEVAARLRKHDVTVELLAVNEGNVRVRANASAHACGSTAATARAVIEEGLYEAAPDIASLAIEGLEPKSAGGFVALDQLRGALLRLNWQARSEIEMNGKPGPPDPMAEEPMTPAHSNALGILRQFARKALPAERCELCGTALSREHAHLVELAAHRLLCACPACALLFDAGANRRYKRVPRRVQLLQSFHMTDAQWDSLLLPINMAFFYSSSVQGTVAAFYPSPAGAVESLLSLEAWNDIVKENPALRDMEPDVEALLVNRVGYSRGTAMAGYFIAPMDECYRLVGLIRAGWRGLSGGAEVWEDIHRFFHDLRQRAEILAGEEHA